MTKTTNYDLNQWDPEDPVIRTDFNADNAKLDAALHELSQRKADVSEVAAKAVIVSGSYQGTGTYGSANRTTLDFAATLGRAPALLIVRPISTGGSGLVLIQGMTRTSCNMGSSTTSNDRVDVIWDKSCVTWYATSEHTQMNSTNTTYFYIAIA